MDVREVMASRLLILSQCTVEIFSKIIQCMNGETNCVFLSGFTLPSCFFNVTCINFRYMNIVFMFRFDKANSMHIGGEVTIYCLLCVPIGLCSKETERVGTGKRIDINLLAPEFYI
jgi:hypothetical protein